MKSSKNIVWCLAVMLASLVPVSLAYGKSKTGMSPEETLVRMAYKKLSVYNTVAKYSEAMKRQKTVNHSLALRFELTNFRVGPIDEIRDVVQKELSSLPTGDTILITRSIESVNNGEEKAGYQAQWSSGQYSSFYEPKWTVDDVLQLEAITLGDIGKYASYEVTVSLEGKTRSYKALCLFHNSPQASENLKAEFWDSVVGMGGTLTHVSQEELLPLGMNASLETKVDSARSLASVKNGAGVSKVITPVTDAGITCPTNSTDLRQCQIDYELADHWNVAPSGWSKGNVNQLVGNGANSSEMSNAELATIEPDEVTTGATYFWISNDHTDHLSGGHNVLADFTGRCTGLPNNSQRCDVDLTGTHFSDGGTVEGWYYHVGRSSQTSRGNTGPRGESISCDTSYGVAWKYCIFSSCTVTPQLSVSGYGLGVSATMSGGDLFNTAHAEGLVCHLPRVKGSGGVGQGPGNPTCGPPGQGPIILIDGNEQSDPCSSPVIIDVAGDGFHLTSSGDGLRFDLNANGYAEKISWTSANSDDAWLALDRNGNGNIDDGTELFGNYTAQPDSPNRNGYLALAEYDKPENGGDANGLINSDDKIFSSLRLWQDQNHNGLSEPDELQELGQLALDLNYTEVKYHDEFGNDFRYRSSLVSSDSRFSRWTYDVYLVYDQSPPIR